MHTHTPLCLFLLPPLSLSHTHTIHTKISEDKCSLRLLSKDIVPIIDLQLEKKEKKKNLTIRNDYFVD